MPETTSAAQPYASDAGSAQGERVPPALVAVGILLALAAAVVLLRLHRLTDLPPGLHHDEGTHGINALQVLQGKHAAFFPENNGREGLIVYAVALATSILGRTALAVRLPTALFSGGAVFLLFWLGWLLFGRDESGRPTPWRGLLVGGAGAGLMAVSLGQTVIGRTALRGNFLPFFLCLCLALLWWGWSRQDGWRIALAGACAGLLPYTYITARFTPFLFLLFGLTFLLPGGARNDGRKKREEGAVSPRLPVLSSLSKAELTKIGIFVGVAGLVAAPILIHFVQHPTHFFLRSSQTHVFAAERNQGNPLGVLLGNAWGYLLAFGLRGDLLWRHNFSGLPLLNLWQAFFFWLGSGMAVRRWRRQPACRLLLLWLVLLVLPAVLARESASVPPNTIRMIGAAPAIYLLVAFGIWEAFCWLRARYARGKETMAAIVLAVAVAGAVLVQGALSYRVYFQKWAHAPEVHRAYGTEWTDLIQLVNEEDPEANVLYLIPGFLWQYSFAFLYQGAAPVYLVHTAMPDFARSVESALAATENLTNVKVVDWSNDVIWTGSEDEWLAVLLSKYGRYLGADAYADFQIHNYTDISLDRPWTLFNDLESMTVHYDGGISLLGLAMGLGVERLPTQQPLDLGESRALWLALQWQTAPELRIDYGISLRLHDAEGAKVYQKDDVLWKPDHSSTGVGGTTEPFETIHLLDFPAELLAGEYELRLVVYDKATLNPTVELGVWEAEALLARLRLAKVGESRGASAAAGPFGSPGR